MSKIIPTQIIMNNTKHTQAEKYLKYTKIKTLRSRMADIFIANSDIKINNTASIHVTFTIIGFLLINPNSQFSLRVATRDEHKNTTCCKNVIYTIFLFLSLTISSYCQFIAPDNICHH